MLTYDALINQAKIRGVPFTKIRGILREYLQVLILKELYKTEEGKKLFFTGGTYLRLVHNLKRFSEDLDFNTEIIT
ncbi:MAG: nucleotidyl transferase AbiEii/AbiGii toxin family protein, partial [Armatimonadetes bacterium]|nr:nucleotidyl transferase AbiEii/AbiGii toxin family protein [Armatimonadota bacterium]